MKEKPVKTTKEDGSVNSLGVIPNGRLIKRKPGAKPVHAESVNQTLKDAGISDK